MTYGLGDDGADDDLFFGIGEGGEGAGPGDVAVAGGVECVRAFTEGPAGAVVGFAQCEEVGGDVLLGFWKELFAHGELIHEGEAEVVLLSGEVDSLKGPGEFRGGFPAELEAEAGLVSSSVEPGQIF